jgi:uncharacterized membrane protein
VEPATVAIGLLTVAVFVLRLTQMHQSLYGDEVWTFQDIDGHSLGSVIRNVHTGAENSPPLFFALAWAAAKLGDTSVWIRVPSLVLGTATIPLIYLLGRDTVGRAAGLAGAAIIGLGPFSIYYGIEARPYATMAFFVTLSTLALVRAVRGGSAWWWALYAVAAAGAAYSHYTSVFVLGVQAAWSLWECRKRPLAPVIANLVVVILYVPWLGHVRGKSLGVIALLEPLNAHNVLEDLPRPLAGYPYAPLHTIPGIWGLAAIGVCALVGAGFLVRRQRQSAAYAVSHSRLGAGFAMRGRGRAGRVGAFAGDPGGLPLLVALALATPVGLFVYSKLGTDLWVARGLYASAPAAALVLGTLLVAPPPRVRLVLVVVVLAVLVLGTVRAISPSYARPQFRTAAEVLDRDAPPGAPVIVYPTFFDQAVQVQARRPHRFVYDVADGWRQARTKPIAYVLIDDTDTVKLPGHLPHPAGFRLIARRHWTGLTWFSLLTYQRISSAHKRSHSRSA